MRKPFGRLAFILEQTDISHFARSVMKKRCPRCNQEKKSSEFYASNAYCKQCFNSYNAERRKVGTERYTKLQLKKRLLREHPMITRAFVEHRLFVDKKKRGAVCEGCRSWQPIEFDKPDKCRSPRCYKMNEQMTLVLPKYHKAQDRFLEDISVCKLCRQVFSDCRCEWKKQQAEIRLMFI